MRATKNVLHKPRHAAPLLGRPGRLSRARSNERLNMWGGQHIKLAKRYTIGMKLYELMKQ